MATFVHIADEKNAASIRRSGLRLPRRHASFKESDTDKYGVFAMPLVENFLLTHQWVRELKRRGFRHAVGVHFHLPDSEPVWIGRFDAPKRQVSAAQALALLRSGGGHDHARDDGTTAGLGLEVIIPRGIRAADVRHIRAVPRVLGWRYYPEAHGKPPFCGCSYCQRGNIKCRKLRQRHAARS